MGLLSKNIYTGQCDFSQSLLLQDTKGSKPDMPTTPSPDHRHTRAHSPCAHGVLRVCLSHLPGAGGDLCEFAQTPEGVASVHVIQRLRAVPQQAEADRVLVAGAVLLVVVMVAVSQVILHNPGRRYETEAAHGDQGGGEEHPEASHTVEHGGSLGQEAHRQTQI